MRLFSVIVAVFIFAIFGHQMRADSQCSATNDNGDQTCSISCPSGQSAQCSNGVSSSPPSCSCSGVPESKFIKNSRFRLLEGKHFETTVATVPDQPSIENTNVIDVINSKLAVMPDHHLSDSCNYQVPPGGLPCHPIYETPGGPITMCVPWPKQVCQAVNGKLSVQSPVIVVSAPKVSVQEPNWHDIPADILMQHGTYTNCGSAQQSQTFQHNVQLQLGQTVTKTKTVQTGSGQSIQINGSIHIGIVQFGGGDTLNFSTSASISDANVESHAQTQQDSVSVPLIVPPMTQTEIRHSFIQYRVPIPFSGTVTVEGQLSSNLEGLIRLSQLLPSEGDRTFDFAGIVTDSTLIDTTTMVLEKKLTNADCAGSSGKLIRKLDRANHF